MRALLPRFPVPLLGLRTERPARDEAVAKGITVNGLAIINNAANPGFAYHTHPPGGLPAYYKDNVIGGAGAFLLVVENFDTFADAIVKKLVAEIAGGTVHPKVAVTDRVPR